MEAVGATRTVRYVQYTAFRPPPPPPPPPAPAAVDQSCCRSELRDPLLPGDSGGMERPQHPCAMRGKECPSCLGYAGGGTHSCTPAHKHGGHLDMYSIAMPIWLRRHRVFPRPDTLDEKPDWALRPDLGTSRNTWLR